MSVKKVLRKMYPVASNGWTYHPDYHPMQWFVQNVQKALNIDDAVSAVLPLGQVIAIADLVDCREIYGRTCVGNECKPIGALLRNEAHGIEVTGNEIIFGDYTPGRYAWMLENIRMIDPVHTKGFQRIWNWKER